MGAAAGDEEEAEIQRLVAALGDAAGGAWEAREGAAQALEALGLAALPWVVSALGDSRWESRLAAAGLVASVRRASAQRAEQGRVVAQEGLAEPGSRHRRAALRALDTLAAAGVATPAADAVGRLVSDPGADVEVRCEAAVVLGRLGAAGQSFVEQAWDAVAHGLRSEEPLVALSAARAVGSLGAAAAHQRRVAGRIAFNYLAHDDWQVRRAAANAIGELGLEELLMQNQSPEGGAASSQVAAVAVLLEDDFIQVQCAAAECLGRLGKAAARHAAAACEVAAWAVTNPVPSVRVSAALALARHSGDPSVAALLEQACATAAAELPSRDRELALGAAQAIGTLAGDAALPHLAAAAALAEAALRDADAALRLEAAAAVGRLHSALEEPTQLACEIAAEELQAESRHTREEAARVFGVLGTDAVGFAFEVSAALADSRGEVRGAAAEALGAMGSAGTGHLGAAMRHADWKTRVSASRALEAQGYEGARDYASLTALRDD